MNRCVKRVLNAFEKRNDPCRPAQSAQVDLGRNFSKFSNFMHVKGLFELIIRLLIKLNGYGSITGVDPGFFFPERGSRIDHYIKDILCEKGAYSFMHVMFSAQADIGRNFLICSNSM